MAKSCAESKARVALGLRNRYIGNLTAFSLTEWKKALISVSNGGISEDMMQAAIEQYDYYRNNKNIAPLTS